MIRSLIFILCAIAALALLIETIGAVFAIITGHVRWIELAWLSFEDGFHEAREWPELPSTKEELERLCEVSGAKHKAA